MSWQVCIDGSRRRNEAAAGLSNGTEMMSIQSHAGLVEELL